MVKTSFFWVLMWPTLVLPAFAFAVDSGVYSGTEDPSGKPCRVEVVSSESKLDKNVTSPKFGDDLLTPIKTTVKIKTSFTGDTVFSTESKFSDDAGLYWKTNLDGRSDPHAQKDDVYLTLDTIGLSPTTVQVPVSYLHGWHISNKVCEKLEFVGPTTPRPAADGKAGDPKATDGRSS